jgi:hypothetical protein
VSLRERLNTRKAGHERFCPFRIRRVSDHYQERYATLHHGRQLIRLVSDATVMGYGYPALLADLSQPVLVRAVWSKTIGVTFDLQASVA